MDYPMYLQEDQWQRSKLRSLAKPVMWAARVIIDALSRP
jgi:hypothetical protein